MMQACWDVSVQLGILYHIAFAVKKIILFHVGLIVYHHNFIAFNFDFNFSIFFVCIIFSNLYPVQFHFGEFLSQTLGLRQVLSGWEWSFQ